MTGGTGADYLYGGQGDDTYFIDNINDKIYENDASGTDTLHTSIGNNYACTYINIENFYLIEDGKNIGFIGNNLNNSITGNSYSNALNGHEGDDVLIGGKGDDSLTGGLGNDLYIFSRGDGADTLGMGSNSANDIDTLEFIGNIAPDQIWLTKDNYNTFGGLSISIIGTTDKVYLPNFPYHRSDLLDQVKAGGKTLTHDKIDQLVSAMAAFSPPALGQTTLPSNYQQALASVISSAWV